MLHVEQYRYPSGPPRGIIPPEGMLSPGGGGRMGLETGGSIPGSVVAVFHRASRAVMETSMEV